MGKRLFLLLPVTIVFLAALPMSLTCNASAETPLPEKVFAEDNLVAWCIVPFDAKKRGPEERARMIKRLGLKKVAYDWRSNHIPTFEAEILAYKKNNIDFFAFWSWHKSMEGLIKKHGIKPQIWITVSSPKKGSQKEKVEIAAKQLLPLAALTKKLGCKLGLYNHGGWGGEPGNMVSVCKWLRSNLKSDHIGIVYNFHHGHNHIKDFPRVLDLMKKYIFCLNLNGMNEGANPKILTIGNGRYDLKMLTTISRSGYRGPIGILDHRNETDSEETLKMNLKGLKKVLRKIQKNSEKLRKTQKNSGGKR